MRRLALLTFALVGCADQATHGGSDLSGMLPDLSFLADLTSGPADLTSASYPGGPYGNKMGDTIPMLSWIGYSVPLGDARATTKPYAAYTMNDLRLSGRPYGVIHVAEFF